MYDTKQKQEIQRKESYQKLKAARASLSKREANTKFPPQACEGFLIEGFGEDISYLTLSPHMDQLNLSFLIVISQEVETDLYVFGL